MHRMAQDQSGSHDVLRRYTVTQVDYLRLGINPVDHTFHDTNKGILWPKSVVRVISMVVLPPNRHCS